MQCLSLEYTRSIATNVALKCQLGWKELFLLMNIYNAEAQTGFSTGVWEARSRFELMRCRTGGESC